MHEDDHVLIDFLTGQATVNEADAARKRLAGDEQFSRRSRKIAGLLKVLDACPAGEPDESLIERTVAAAAAATRTQALIDREAVRSRAVNRPTFSLKELGAMAALLFLVAAILLPSFRHASQLSRERACVGQTGKIGTALTHYANDHGGQLPSMGQADASWMAGSDAETFLANSQNLWRLVHGGYAPATLFQCPARSGGGPIETAKLAMFTDFPADEFISYSYHNGVNAEPLRTDSIPTAAAKHMAILADSSPVFDGGRFRPSRVGFSNSLNHDQRGQAVLFLDMHSEWTQRSSVGVGGDNIWLIQGVYTYTGVERPSNPIDSFLLPSYRDASP